MSHWIACLQNPRPFYLFFRCSCCYKLHRVDRSQNSSFIKVYPLLISKEVALIYWEVYSSSRFILLVWARTTIQSNPCQHPLPELLFSLITIMRRGMGKAGGGLWTHLQSKERSKDTRHCFHLFWCQWSSHISSLKRSGPSMWRILIKALWTGVISPDYRKHGG